MQFNGVTKNYVAILNNDGSLADVNTDSSFDNFVHRCLSQNDGKLVCGGLFSQYQSNPSKGVVRIIPNDLLSINETNSTKIKIAPNPTSDIISVFIEDNTQANLYDANGKLIQTFFLQPKQNTISLANYPHGVYIIELISKTQKQRFKLIKK